MAKGIKVRHGRASYPYSVGLVVESLQGAGLSTDVAIQLAKDLEKIYRKEESKIVRLDSLVSRLAKMIEKESGKRVSQRFREQTPPFVPLKVILKNKEVTFSKEILAKHLQKLDLSEKESLSLSGQIEQSLRSHGYQEISGRELTHWVAIYLEATYGREVRYLFEMQQGQSTDILVLEKNGET
jgi:2-phosphoglycerate kinase